MNVAALFDTQARRAPHATALTWDEGADAASMDYGTLRELAHRTAHLLLARGIATDDRVAILLPNTPAFAVALLGTLWRGATAAILSPAWAPADASRALAEADARLLVTTQALAEAVNADPGRTLVVDDAPTMGSFGAALARLAMAYELAPTTRSADMPATILFSSGTTGDPKGVVLTHGNLAFNAWSKIRYCGITPADRLAMVVPMAHCFGQNVVLLGALLAGAAVRIHERFETAAVLEQISRGEVTMLLAAPTAFARLLASDDGAATRRLRYALTAAAPLPDELAARWREVSGRPLSQGYGLTECSPFATYAPAVLGNGRCVGRPIEGVQLRIVAQEGDAAGEIAIRGPNVMAGYWRRPEATAHALRGGWLHTGDVGRLNGDGTVQLVDRMDDVINVAGFKAWPSDVERVLARHPSVLEVAAYGAPDALRGATVAAALVLREGAEGDVDALSRFAARHLASFQRPARLRIVSALPRSASGKVLRRALAAEDQRALHDTPAYSERPATGLPAASR